MNLWRFQYCPPWKLSQPWLPGVGCGDDEWHNSSWWVVFPFLGQFVFFPRLDRTGEEHLHAFVERWHGRYVPGCEGCEEFREFVGEP